MPQSITFWCVLFGAAIVYWRLPVRWRMAFLAIVSAGYLLSIDVFSTLAVIAWVGIFYRLTPGPDAPRGRARTTALVLAALGFLAIFKYLAPLITTLAASMHFPVVLAALGVSYYTFKLIHYAVERRRGNLPAHGFDDFACYMLLFPIFTAGPIERFDHFMRHRTDTWRAADAVEGLTRIVHGLIKKFVIAGMLLPAWTKGMTGDLFLVELPGLDALEVARYLLATFLMLYLDFSAYSDLAIGASRLFGLTIMENFNWPIVAVSLIDFWRRWHMSLVNWCQSYVYTTMIGLTRSPYLAAYATFLVMGLWHAGTLHWVAWGLWHATGVSINVTWARRKRMKGWKLFSGPIDRWLGLPLVLAWVAVGVAFPLAHAAGGSTYDALRVIVKLIGIDLPP